MMGYDTELGGGLETAVLCPLNAESGGGRTVERQDVIVTRVVLEREQYAWQHTCDIRDVIIIIIIIISNSMSASHSCGSCHCTFNVLLIIKLDNCLLLLALSMRKYQLRNYLCCKMHSTWMNISMWLESFAVIACITTSLSSAFQQLVCKCQWIKARRDLHLHCKRNNKLLCCNRRSHGQFAS